MIIGRNGEVLGEYFNRGHIYDMLAVDLDGDGRQALICAGANNKEPYHGGTVFVLDREHCRGAAVDPINGGNLEVEDGSRSRILLPSFGPEILGRLGTPRTSVWKVRSAQSLEGGVTLLATVGYKGLMLHLLLDADLNPLAFRPTDNVPITVATWPVEDPATYGPNCPAWRHQWMQEIVQVSPRRLEQLAAR